MIARAQHNVSIHGSVQVHEPSIGAPTAMIALTVIALPFFLLAILGGEAITALSVVSAKFEMLKSGSELLIALLAIAAIAAIGLGAWLLAGKRYLFIVLLFFSVSFSEVTVAALNQAAFGIRYLLFLVLTALGVVQLARVNREVLDSTVLIGLMLLSWIAIDLVLTGATGNATAMIPIQVTMLLGVLVGLKSRFVRKADIRDVCVVFGWIGAIATVIHLSAIFIHPSPFIGGRFRSIFPLPTNFANGYVLLFISMIWLLFYERRAVWKIVLAALVVAGAALIFLTGTRNAMLAVAIALVFFSFAWRVRILAYGAITALLAGTVAVAFVDESRSVSSLSNRLASSDTVRWEVWDRAIAHIEERPVTGYGLGVNMNELDTRLPDWVQFNTHNAYLGIWLQIGIVGLGLVSLLYFVALKTAFATLFSRGLDPSVREVLILPTTLLVVLLIAGMFEENLNSRGSLQQILWVFCIALVMNIRASVLRPPAPAPASIP